MTNVSIKEVGTIRCTCGASEYTLWEHAVCSYVDGRRRWGPPLCGICGMIASWFGIHREDPAPRALALRCVLGGQP